MSDKKTQPEKKEFYFGDEYVVSAKIAFGNGFPDVNLKYKPLNIFQSSQLADSVMKLRGIEGAMAANTEMMSKHLVEWDVKKPDGSAVDPHNPEELRKMSPKLLTRVGNLIRGDSSTLEQDARELDSLKN